MKTSFQEFIENHFYINTEGQYEAKYTEDTTWTEYINESLEKEKEQIQKAFSDGQETPINHPTLPHYSREEYYNDNYK